MMTAQQQRITNTLKNIFPIRSDKEIVFNVKDNRLFVVFNMHWNSNKRINALCDQLGNIALYPQGNFKYMFNVRAEGNR